MQPFYTFIINDKKYQNYKKIASFLFLINAAFFILLALRSASVSGRIILFTAAFILVAYSMYNWRYKKKKDKSHVLIYVLIALIWISDTPFWYVSIIFLIIFLLQFRMESDFTIHLSGQYVTVDGFIRNNYEWSDLNNVLLKDGLLTLDFKNNRIMQVEPEWNEWLAAKGAENQDAGEIYLKTEKEFNDFCRQQLNK